MVLVIWHKYLHHWHMTTKIKFRQNAQQAFAWHTWVLNKYLILFEEWLPQNNWFFLTLICWVEESSAHLPILQPPLILRGGKYTRQNSKLLQVF